MVRANWAPCTSRDGARNEGQFIFWTRKAAEQGHAVAQANLGWAYEEGRGVGRDARLAAEWYGKAYLGLPGMAEAGHPAAQFRVGNMYLMGLGLPKDEKKGLAWIRKAAEAGCITAQAQLGSLYARGSGVAKDEQQAVEWYRKAIAADDYAPAQYNLALMHVLGQGMPKDEKRPHRCFARRRIKGCRRRSMLWGRCIERVQENPETKNWQQSGFAGTRTMATPWPSALWAACICRAGSPLRTTVL